jgi:hypothetical protein
MLDSSIHTDQFESVIKQTLGNETARNSWLVIFELFVYIRGLQQFFAQLILDSFDAEFLVAP